jgi:hypothetical protein
MFLFSAAGLHLACHRLLFSSASIPSARMLHQSADDGPAGPRRGGMRSAWRIRISVIPERPEFNRGQAKIVQKVGNTLQ